MNRSVASLGEGVLALGPGKEVVLVNATAERFLELRASVVGRRLDEILPDEHPVRRMAETLYSEDVRSLTVMLQAIDSGQPHAAVGHRIAGNGDGAGGVLIEIKALSEVRDLHSLAYHSKVLSRLAQMAAGVAHEIRNPLQAIHLELDLLRTARDMPPEEIEEHVEAATEDIRRLQRAVTGFLRIARLQRMPVAQLCLGDLLQDIRRTLEAETNVAGLELLFDVEPDLPEIVGDAEVLRQAVLNLTRNAIEAQPSRDGRIRVWARTEGHDALVSVEDTGPGIPPADRERVFELYYSTKQDGTGVGLALVRQAMELHSGEVELDSDAKRGTTVTLRFATSAIHASDAMMVEQA